jgi:hypothetical protein
MNGNKWLFISGLEKKTFRRLKKKNRRDKRETGQKGIRTGH